MSRKHLVWAILALGTVSALLLCVRILRTPVSHLPRGAALLVGGYLGPEMLTAEEDELEPTPAVNIGPDRLMAFGDDYFCWLEPETNTLCLKGAEGDERIPCPPEWGAGNSGVSLFCTHRSVYARVSFTRKGSIVFRWYGCDRSGRDRWRRFSDAEDALADCGVARSLLNHEVLDRIDRGTWFALSADRTRLALGGRSGIILVSDLGSHLCPLPREVSIGLGHISCVGFGPSAGIVYLGVSMPTGIRPFIARADLTARTVSNICALPWPTFGPVELVSSDSPIVRLLAR